MNIKITYNWLLDFLKTDASPFEIQKYLSLSGPSIERVEKVDDDYVFDIEIISNRIDTASVIGIVQEAVAILPIYNLNATFKFNPLTELRFETIKDRFNPIFNLKLKINHDLCSRFAALIFDKITLGESPPFIKKRLAAAGIKVINNVVDISNYLMLTLGQPVHMFDYDRVAGRTMILRASKTNETITLLDKQAVKLPVGSIVIEDGEGDLTDLCGIMGGLKSAINKQTKRIIFFVQTYNKQRVRRTVMETGVRTLAATYFEKGLDEERVEPTIVYGTKLLEKYAGGVVASNLIDLYPKPYQAKSVRINYSFFEKMTGIKMERKIVNQILIRLGFTVKSKANELVIGVPSFRKNDIDIAEDLVEEVARIWGYHKIPGSLSPAATVIQPESFKKTFKTINQVKRFLKHLGFTEVINYSMISNEMIDFWGLKTEDHLRLKNTISKEIEFMRLSLLPSLYKNVIDNLGKKESLKFFEIAKVYWPKKNSLPEEYYRLAMVVNTDYFDLKGIIEALLAELNIKDIDLIARVDQDFYANFFNSQMAATGLINNRPVIFFGAAKKDSNIFLAEIYFDALVDYSNLINRYQPINPYAVIKQDITTTIDQKRTFIFIKKIILKSSSLIQRVEFLDRYQNKVTLRLYFNHPHKNLTEEQVRDEIEKIKMALGKG